MNGIGLGIAAGLVTTALIWILRSLWSRYLMPFFDKSIQIEGVWSTEISFPDGATNKHRIDLKRFAYTVRGDAICEEGWGKGFRYRLGGTFKNLLLTAQYEASDKRKLERGSFTLRLENGGSVLRGYLTYFDNERNQISVVACEWRAEGAPEPNPSRAAGRDIWAHPPNPANRAEG